LLTVVCLLVMNTFATQFGEWGGGGAVVWVLHGCYVSEFQWHMRYMRGVSCCAHYVVHCLLKPLQWPAEPSQKLWMAAAWVTQGLSLTLRFNIYMT
jgi:hypothetical protein